MTAGATRENTDPNDRAGDKYEIVVKSAPQPEKALRWLGFLVAGIISEGTGFNPGGATDQLQEPGDRGDG